MSVSDVGASSGTSAERARQKVLLVNGRQYLRGTSLESLVRYSGHPERALFLLSGLRNIDTPYLRRSISPTVDGLQHACNPFLKTFFRFRHGLPIYSGRGFGRNLAKTLPHPLPCNVMSQRRKPK